MTTGISVDYTSQFPAKSLRGARVLMQKGILVVNTDKKQCRELCELIEKERYSVSALHSIQNLETHLEEKKLQAVIIDKRYAVLDGHGGQSDQSIRA
jgi:DNA-binding NtrC family response regulator